jgi:hypothetical protein
VDASIPIAGGTTERRTVTHIVEVSADRVARLKSAQWRLVPVGADESGRACEVTPADAALVFPEPTVGNPPSVPDEVIMAAGDVARCGSPMHEATAKILDRFPTTVLALGDLAYMTGTAEEFRNCYDPSWGRHKRRTRPAAGNHDWDNTGGGPYIDYFAGTAGLPGQGYYTYTLGAWRLIALNSNIPAAQGSPQYEVLRSTLATVPKTDCLLAYWHHPLFSSGQNGSVDRMKDAWRLLGQSGADLILQAHDHLYERFAPQDFEGRVNPQEGIRSFVVGTGGFDLYDVRTRRPNSQVLENRTWGVLKVTLRSASYDWEFVPVDGQSFTDFGTQACSPAR